MITVKVNKPESMKNQTLNRIIRLQVRINRKQKKDENQIKKENQGAFSQNIVVSQNLIQQDNSQYDSLTTDDI